MGQRLQFQEVLEDIMGNGNVYFQPPSNVQMAYPCIVYHVDLANTQFAGNKPYRLSKRYMVTVIDANPDSQIPDKVAQLPMCTFSRFFVADQLNHSVFNIYF
jgi:hypothetical protein